MKRFYGYQGRLLAMVAACWTLQGTVWAQFTAAPASVVFTNPPAPQEITMDVVRSCDTGSLLSVSYTISDPTVMVDLGGNVAGNIIFSAGELTNQPTFEIIGLGTVDITFDASGCTPLTHTLEVFPGSIISPVPSPVNVLTNLGMTTNLVISREAVNGTTLMNSTVTIYLASSDTNVFTVSPVQFDFTPVGGVIQSSNVVITAHDSGSAMLLITNSLPGYYDSQAVMVNVAADDVLDFDINPVNANLILSGVNVITAQVTRTATLAGSLDNALVADVTVGNPGIITAATTVTFPAEPVATSQTVPVVITGVAAGTSALTVSAPGYGSGASIFTVYEDNEVRLTLPTDTVYLVSTGTARNLQVVRSAVVAGDLNRALDVTVNNLQPGIFSASPATLTFPPTNALTQVQTLTLTALAEGNGQFVLTASDPGYNAVTGAVIVVENAALQLDQNLYYVTLDQVISVGVRRQGALDVPLTITLARPSDNTSFSIKGDGAEFAASATINLQPGEELAVFQLRGDALTGVQAVELTASANGYPSSQADIFVILTCDSTGNGIPDFWSLQYFGQLDVEAGDDPDGDGLSNLTEFLAGLDPTNPDTTGNGLSDYFTDMDGDGLLTGEEQDFYLTHPNLRDSDDDGIPDAEELANNTDPLNSLSPYQRRALRFLPGGAGEIIISEVTTCDRPQRYNNQIFTLEFWLSPAEFPGDSVRQPILSRPARVGGATRMSPEVGLEGNRIYARMETGGGNAFELVTGVTLQADEWTHVAVRLDEEQMTIFIDGAPARSGTTALLPGSGLGGYVIGGGAGYRGDLRDIRIWKVGRTDAEIDENRFLSLVFNEETVAPKVLEAVGDTGHLRYNDLQFRNNLQEWTIEAWVKADSGGGTILSKWNTPNPGEGDYNFFMDLDEQGRVRAGFAGQYTKITYEFTNGLQVITGIESVVDTSDRNTIQGALRIADGQWHHVAYTRNATSAVLYVDGLIDSIIDGYLYPVPGSNEEFIGGRPRSLDGPMVVGYELQGMVDEARVWDRVLTLTEIDRQRRENLIGNEPGLLTYFNFDNHDDTGLTVLNRTALFTDPPSTEFDYGVLAPNARIVAGRVNPTEAVGFFKLFPFRVLGGVSLVSFFSGEDGRVTLEDHIYQNQPGLGGILNAFVRFADLGNQYPAPDSDGDGLPDWWETANGLDPMNASGNDGAFGDVDGDGLSNLAEFRAGADPGDWDSNGNGIPDYDDAGAEGASLGLLYDDGDGMDNVWEASYPGTVNPEIYDAHLDPDGDGWSNYAEYLAGTSPADASEYPTPTINQRLFYNGIRPDGVLWIHFFSSPEMDGIPDAVAVVGRSQLIVGTQVGEIIEAGTGASGTFPLAPLVPGSAVLRINGIVYQDVGSGVLRSVDVTPVRFGNVDYTSGEWSASLLPARGIPGDPVFADWEYTFGSAGYPFEGAAGLIQGYVREGPLYVFSWIDNNADGVWTEGEPAAVPAQQPLTVGFGNVPRFDMELTDNLSGYHRFAAPSADPASAMTVTVTRVSSDGAPVVIDQDRVIRRNYYHEGDFRSLGLFGLDAGESLRPGYQWLVGTNDSGIFNFNWDAQLPAPVISAPAGDALIPVTRAQLSWTMSAQAVNIRLQIMRNAPNGEIIYDETMPIPVRDGNGLYRMRLPLIPGDEGFTNGRYFWRVQALTPATASLFSSPVSFQIDLREGASESYAITGDLRYYGFANTGDFIVEAYLTPGFNGTPEARIRMSEAGEYRLLGLEAGTYYVKAYRDQNQNGMHDLWEPAGMIRDGGFYEANAHPAGRQLPVNRRGRTILLRDRDVNNNNLSDSYERLSGLDFWGAIDVGSGWHWSDWLGFFNTDYFPWIYHNEHGWLYHFGEMTDSSHIIFYDDNLQNIWWTSRDVYSFLYNFDVGDWWYYLPDSRAPRWFFNYANGEWEAR